MMEHNSNFVPWHALCREILPRFGRRVECRLARFDPVTGELDLDHLASLDRRADQAGLLHRRVQLPGHQDPAGRGPGAGRRQRVSPAERRAAVVAAGRRRAAGAERRSSTCRLSTSDYLAFSFHKLLAPVRRRACCTPRSSCWTTSLPFLYGGDMIAEGPACSRITSTTTCLPWKYAAGTPNILGAIVGRGGAAAADRSRPAPRQLRVLPFRAPDPVRGAVSPGHGPRSPTTPGSWPSGRSTGIGADPRRDDLRAADAERAGLAGRLQRGRSAVHSRSPSRSTAAGVESRAGCHCATLAHRHLGLEPLASCRLSFYLYNTVEEVELAARRAGGDRGAGPYLKCLTSRAGGSPSPFRCCAARDMRAGQLTEHGLGRGACTPIATMPMTPASDAEDDDHGDDDGRHERLPFRQSNGRSPGKELCRAGFSDRSSQPTPVRQRSLAPGGGSRFGYSSRPDRAAGSRSRWEITAETPSPRIVTPYRRVGDLHRALLVRDDQQLALARAAPHRSSSSRPRLTSSSAASTSSMM